MPGWLYWSLRAFLLLLAIGAVYGALVGIDGDWWLDVSMILVIAVVFSMIDQPLRDWRKGRGAR